MKIAIYSRKSKITDRGESIKNQINMCQNYILSNFGVSENDIIVYEDEGFSAKNTDRPEFQKLIKAVKEKEFNAVVCYRLDRISRSVVDFSAILEILNKYNTSFVSISEHFDTSTPIGRAMMYIASVFAQLERETTAQRIKDNLSRLARTGRYIGSTPPTGFKSEKIDYTDSKGNNKKMHRLAPIDDEIKFVKLLFDKFYEFNSLSKLETWLMQNGIKNKNNNFIGSSEIRRILTNPVYVKASYKIYDYYNELGSEIVNKREEFTGENGMLIYGRHDRLNSVYRPESWMVVLAWHKGVIDDDKWLKVQKILKKNSLKAPRAGKSERGLLTSKIKCGLCGSTMVMIYGADKKRHYYKCSRKRKSRGALCNVKNLTGIDADNEILSYIKNLNLDKNVIAEMIKSRKNTKIDINSYKIEEENIKNSIKEKEKEIKNLTLQLRKSENSAAAKYIISDIESLDSELQHLKKAIEKTKTQNSQKPKDSLKITDIIDLDAENGGFSFDEKRRYIDDIIDKIIWDGIKMTVFFRQYH